MECRTLAALGDSITYGYPYTPQESWVEILKRETGWHVINAGVSGDTFNDMILRLEKEVLIHRPQIVTLMGGTNDVYVGMSQPQIKQSFLAIVERLQKEKIQIWIGLPLPVDDPTERCLMSWRSWLKIFCREQGLVLVDFYQDFINNDGKIREDLLLDGCHPRIKGYEVMGRRIMKTLENLGLKK